MRQFYYNLSAKVEVALPFNLGDIQFLITLFQHISYIKICTFFSFYSFFLSFLAYFSYLKIVIRTPFTDLFTFGVISLKEQPSLQKTSISTRVFLLICRSRDISWHCAYSIFIVEYCVLLWSKRAHTIVFFVSRASHKSSVAYYEKLGRKCISA